MSEQNESLYSLVAQANALSRMLAETGGEITPEIESLMSNVDVKLPEKVDGYAVVMERLELEAKYWKDKAASYSLMAKSLASLQDKLKERLKEAIKALGVDEIHGNDVRFKLSGVKPALVLDESKLDPSYLMTVTETVPDKERIRAALQEGAEISGASLVQSVSLRSYLNKKAK